MRAAVLCLSILAAQAGSAPPVTSLHFESGVLLVAGGNTVRVARDPQWAQEGAYTSRLAQVYDAAVRPDGRVLAIAGGSAAITGAVELYETRTKSLLRTVARAGDLVYAAAFSPDGKRIAAASADHYGYLVDAESGERIARLEGHVGPVLCVAFSPDGKTLATGSADRSIRLWDANGKLLRSLQNHAGAVTGVIFSADSQTLYSASEDATLREWVVGNGRMKRIYRGFEAPVLSLAASPSRDRLVAAGADGALRIVDSQTGAILKTIGAGRDHAAWAHAVAVSGDGKWIASADAAGQLRVEAFPQ
jgi:WD40 repeat protein